MNDIYSEELQSIYINAPYQLIKSQKLYESNIGHYVNARDLWSQACYEYEKAYAEEVEKLKDQDVKVTVVKEIAKKACLEKYRAMLQAETMKKKFKYFIQAGEKRIDTIKKIMSIDTNKMT